MHVSECHMTSSWLPESFLKEERKNVAQNFVFKKRKRKRKAKNKRNRNQNLPENCPPTASKALSERHNKKQAFFFWKYTKTLTRMHLSLLSSHICVQVGATYLPYRCTFFFSPGVRHGLMGPWPFHFKKISGVAPVLLSISFYVTEKFPLVLKMDRCKDGCY